MSERLEKLYPCPGCDFHDFSQVQQCEPSGETCKWLLSLIDNQHTLCLIKEHWYEDVPPFTMPFLNGEYDAVQQYIQDMTEWGRKLGEFLGGYSQFIEKGEELS